MELYGLAFTFIGVIVHAQSHPELNPLYYEVSETSGPRSPVSRDGTKEDKGTSLGTRSSPWWFTQPAFSSKTTERMPPTQVKCRLLGLNGQIPPSANEKLVLKSF